ncbi:hypothetical protein CLOM_g1315 [Closterium sp. NIES-68]|nr:hypothetical protein CLOM_g1315 [Closterium sp. NIES-68]
MKGNWGEAGCEDEEWRCGHEEDEGEEDQGRGWRKAGASAAAEAAGAEAAGAEAAGADAAGAGSRAAGAGAVGSERGDSKRGEEERYSRVEGGSARVANEEREEERTGNGSSSLSCDSIDSLPSSVWLHIFHRASLPAPRSPHSPNSPHRHPLPPHPPHSPHSPHRRSCDESQSTRGAAVVAPAGAGAGAVKGTVWGGGSAAGIVDSRDAHGAAAGGGAGSAGGGRSDVDGAGEAPALADAPHGAGAARGADVDGDDGCNCGCGRRASDHTEGECSCGGGGRRRRRELERQEVGGGGGGEGRGTGIGSRGERELWEHERSRGALGGVGGAHGGCDWPMVVCAMASKRLLQHSVQTPSLRLLVPPNRLPSLLWFLSHASSLTSLSLHFPSPPLSLPHHLRHALIPSLATLCSVHLSCSSCPSPLPRTCSPRAPTLSSSPPPTALSPTHSQSPAVLSDARGRGGGGGELGGVERRRWVRGRGGRLEMGGVAGRGMEEGEEEQEQEEKEEGKEQEEEAEGERSWGVMAWLGAYPSLRHVSLEGSAWAWHVPALAMPPSYRPRTSDTDTALPGSIAPSRPHLSSSPPPPPPPPPAPFFPRLTSLHLSNVQYDWPLFSLLHHLSPQLTCLSLTRAMEQCSLPIPHASSSPPQSPSTSSSFPSCLSSPLSSFSSSLPPAFPHHLAITLHLPLARTIRFHFTAASRLSFLLCASPRLSSLSIVGGGCPVTVLNTPHLHSLVAGCIDLSVPHLLSVRHLYLLVEPNALLLRQPTRVLPGTFAEIATPGSVHGPADNLSGFLPGFSPGSTAGLAGVGGVERQWLSSETSSDAEASIEDMGTHFTDGQSSHSSLGISSSSSSSMGEPHSSSSLTQHFASTLQHTPLSPSSTWLARVAGTVQILVARRVIGQLECGTWDSLRSMAVKCISSRRHHHRSTPPFSLSSLHRQQPVSFSGATISGNTSNAASPSSALRSTFAAAAGQGMPAVTQGRLGDVPTDLYNPLHHAYNPHSLPHPTPPSAIPCTLFSSPDSDSSESSLLPLPVGGGLLGFFCCLLGAPCSRASLHALLLHCPLMRSLHVWVPASAETWRWDVRSGWQDEGGSEEEWDGGREEGEESEESDDEGGGRERGRDGEEKEGGNGEVYGKQEECAWEEVRVGEKVLNLPLHMPINSMSIANLSITAMGSSRGAMSQKPLSSQRPVPAFWRSLHTAARARQQGSDRGRNSDTSSSSGGGNGGDGNGGGGRAMWRGMHEFHEHLDPSYRLHHEEMYLSPWWRRDPW